MKALPLALLLSGLLAASAQAYSNNCGNDGDNDDDCPPPPVGSNPINPQRACLLREVTDIQTFGAAPIVFTRHYNSRPREYTKPRWELGTQYTWQHNWQYEVRESSTTDFGFPRLIVRYPKGREYYFQAVDATGSVRVPKASSGDRLYPTGTDTYTLRTPEGREFDFQKTGSGSSYQYLLTQVRNGTGWKWTLTYQTVGGAQRLYRITNNYGRYLQIARTAGANGYYQITSVTANDGRSVTYGYGTWAPTSETVLTSVTYPDATAAAYTWCGASSITSGAPLLASANDPMQSTSGSRMKYTYNYTAAYFTPPYGIVNGTIYEERNLVTNQVVVSFPLGSGDYPQVLEGNGTELTRKYEHGLSKEWADGEGRTTTATRDASGWGYITNIAKPLGGTTTFTRDYAGRVLTRTDAYGKVRTYTYNTSGFLLTETDEENHTTTYTRGSDNRVSRIDHPDTTYETFTYTGTGLKKTHRLRNGTTESWTYDSWGNLATHTDAAGKLWTYTSHANGLQASVEDPLHHTTSYLYDWRGHPAKITHPDATFREYTYTTYGKKASFKDELGHTWNYTYTEYNQLATTTDPLAHTTTYEYGREPGCGTCGYLPTLARITLPSGKVTENHYDLSGKLTSKVVAPGTADESTTGYAYDAKGRLEDLTDPRGKITHYTYDLLDRKKTETDPLAHTTTWDYDDVGNIEKVTRADGSFSTSTYDAMDRLLTATNPKNETTTFTYHPDGSLATLQDARGNTYAFTVDALSRRTRLDYPGTPSPYETWTYDDAGNITNHRIRDGSIRTSVYDNRNRETDTTWASIYPMSAITRTYYGDGRLHTTTDGSLTLTYGYDASGQLTGETYDFGGSLGTKNVGYAYDADGNRETLTYPDGTVVDYTYTQRNQVATISAAGPPPLATFTYDAAGNRLTKALENGTVATSTYDDAGRLDALVHVLSATPFASADYDYNAIDLRTGETRQGSVTDSYTYDAADQLSGMTHGLGGSETYTYDAVGNRKNTTSPTWVAGNKTYATANPRNEYTTVGAAAFTYDSLGNLLETPIPDTYQYRYDAQNRFVFGKNSYVPTGDAVSFTYDPRNRSVVRNVASVPTYAIYDEWNLIAEYDAAGALKAKYIHGPRVDEMLARIDTTGTRYFHENGLGSTVALTNETGAVVERYTYSAYGVPKFWNAAGSSISASAQNNRFLFTGREWFKDARVYDYRNRAYSPYLGRFLQTDPIRFAARDTNLYRYCGNNPVRWIDSFGLEKECDCPEKEPTDNPHFKKQTGVLSFLTNAAFHHGLTCYREAVPENSSQCCYDKNGDFSEGDVDNHNPDYPDQFWPHVGDVLDHVTQGTGQSYPSSLQNSGPGK